MTLNQHVASLPERLLRDGFAMISAFVGESTLKSLNADIESAGLTSSRSGGVRNLASRAPLVAEFATSTPIRTVLRAILGDEARLRRSILFDKTPGANWNLGWHQDLTIAVEQRANIPGYGPWTEKADVTSVQPPVSILEQMITLRLHLDPCTSDNAPLRVLGGSHVLGRLGATDIAREVTQRTPHVCTGEAGSLLVMRPLLLHASSPATDASHRRVVHLDFAACELASGLEWSPIV